MRGGWRLWILVLAPVIAGCGAPSPAGKYHCEQDNNAFGPGAEKIILDLRRDNTFDVKAGPLVMFAGQWEQKEGQVVFSEAGHNMALQYRQEGTALVPMKEGKPITFWRWRRN